MEKTAIQWHPGFYGAAELELISNRNVLEFQREYHLSKEPLRMDLLIIKKLADVRLENEIGRIFKKYNVVEYKSPEDSLSIDDYFKTIGYACLYKGLGNTVNQVPADELTVSIFREGYPRELFEVLEKSGVTLEERFPGIYYVFGNVLFNTQIVVTSRLNPKVHSGLRILSKQATEEDIRNFISNAKLLTDPGDKNNADAVLQVSISANERLYEKIRRDFGMCEALRKLMRDEIAAEMAEARAKGMAQGIAQGIEQGMAQGIEQGIEQGMAQGIEQGMEKGMAEGMDNAILTSIINLMDTMKWTAEQAMEAIKVPVTDRGKYASRL